MYGVEKFGENRDSDYRSEEGNIENHSHLGTKQYGTGGQNFCAS